MNLTPAEQRLCLRALPLLQGDLQYAHDVEKARGNHEREPEEIRELAKLIEKLNFSGRSERRKAAHQRKKGRAA